MRKYIKTLAVLATICSTLAIGMIVGCRDSQQVQIIDNRTVVLGYSELQIVRGESYTLEASLSVGEGIFTWESSDTSVVTVDKNGKLYGVQKGTATVTATCGDKKASCIVTVELPAYAPIFAEPSQSLYVGIEKSYPIDGTVTFGGVVASEATVTYTSSDPTIATVDEKGIVTGVKSGATTVLVRADYYGLLTEMTVNVNVSNTNVELVSSIFRADLETVTNEELGFFKTETLSLQVSYGGEDISDSLTYEWSVENDEVATIEASTAKAAVVTAQAVGSTTVNVGFTYEGESFGYTFLVNVAYATKQLDPMEFVLNGNYFTLDLSEITEEIQSITVDGKEVTNALDGQILKLDKFALAVGDHEIFVKANGMDYKLVATSNESVSYVNTYSGMSDRNMELNEYTYQGASMMTLKANGDVYAVALSGASNEVTKSADVQGGNTYGADGCWVNLQNGVSGAEHRVFLPKINFAASPAAIAKIEMLYIRCEGFSFTRTRNAESNMTAYGEIEFKYDGTKIIATAKLTKDATTESALDVALDSYTITDEAIISGAKSLTFSVWNGTASNSRMELKQVELTRLTALEEGAPQPTTSVINSYVSADDPKGYTPMNGALNEFTYGGASNVTLNGNGGVYAVLLSGTGNEVAQTIDTQRGNTYGADGAWVVLQNTPGEHRVFIPKINFAQAQKSTAKFEFFYVRCDALSFTREKTDNYNSGYGIMKFEYDQAAGKITATATLNSGAVLASYDITDTAIINGEKSISFSIWSSNTDGASRFEMKAIELTTY